MRASHPNAASAILHRAGLLAGLLAVLAGILGMHVMTGSHSMHSPAALTAAVGTAKVHAESTTAHGHTAHGPVDTSSAHSSGGHEAASVSMEQCSCSDNCTGMNSMAVSCTPSAKTGSLSAPLPGTVVFSVISNAGAPGAVLRSYSYLPGSPSPGELSISRT
ncbi:hypothetical protein QFZ79_002050 [Arthrobacter sp. V4I6]|uniref:hypothetical protein n=1 Tax=unclassified Arthrobacter TaxID=235627 RepID=UPI002781B2FA|nr:MULTISPECIES: hypothetical protein [unclassified Arthrobacter]MDQ0819760.1 hypothetical protein [Arthrobacter sp. V1I7]MDQ0853939.1 hypothetical protein [Arthrobacter sp. V4I6]